MVNYQNGKIYKIVCNTSNKAYVGSTTTQLLCQRLAEHISLYKRFKNGEVITKISSFQVIEKGNYSIILLKVCPCNSKAELLMEERKFIDSLDCVNKTNSTQTNDAMIIQTKENKDSNKEAVQKYYQKNKDKIAEQKKLYRQNNKELIAEQNKRYKDANKEKVAKQRKIYNERIKAEKQLLKTPIL